MTKLNALSCARAASLTLSLCQGVAAQTPCEIVNTNVSLWADTATSLSQQYHKLNMSYNYQQSIFIRQSIEIDEAVREYILDVTIGQAGNYADSKREAIARDSSALKAEIKQIIKTSITLGQLRKLTLNAIIKHFPAELALNTVKVITKSGSALYEMQKVNQEQAGLIDRQLALLAWQNKQISSLANLRGELAAGGCSLQPDVRLRANNAAAHLGLPEPPFSSRGKESIEKKSVPSRNSPTAKFCVDRPSPSNMNHNTITVPSLIPSCIR